MLASSILCQNVVGPAFAYFFPMLRVKPDLYQSMSDVSITADLATRNLTQTPSQVVKRNDCCSDQRLWPSPQWYVQPKVNRQYNYGDPGPFRSEVSQPCQPRSGSRETLNEWNPWNFDKLLNRSLTLLLTEHVTDYVISRGRIFAP